MRKRTGVLTTYRALAMVFILLCHYNAESTVGIVSALSQFFNVGVEMFVLLSGFLFGQKGDQIYSNIKSWYLKRIRRIFVPYELFVALLFVIHLIKGSFRATLDWFLLVLGLQGTVVGVVGAEHTWFISAILLCYLLTPALSFLYDKTPKLRMLMMICFALLPLALALVPAAFVFTLGSKVCLYALAYIFGRRFNVERMEQSKALTFSVAGLLGAIAVRLVAKSICDGTIWYDRVAVGYTQMVIAIGILIVCTVIFRNRNAPQLLSNIADISFEVYLVHYMFCVGPVKLFGCTGWWGADAALVTAISVFLGSVLHVAAGKLLRLRWLNHCTN